jgi:chloramphenicol-sensitive protein RarD
MSMEQEKDSPRGLAFALGAYGLWGFLPLYMKALADVPTLEVLAHRVLWSVPVSLIVLTLLGRTTDLWAALRNPRMVVMAGVTALLVAANWGIYVYSIQTGQALEAALGYYSNPLFSVLLAATLLGERLDRWQWLAIALATLAVVILTVEAGRVPMVATGLFLTWGFYGYLKKKLPIGPNQGFALEVILLLPIALAYLVWLGADGHFWTGTTTERGLLLLAGVVTATPLMLYANGAKLLRLSTIGMVQYLTPTMIFLLAVLLFGEPFAGARLVAFPLIWAALAIYTWRLIRSVRAG